MSDQSRTVRFARAEPADAASIQVAPLIDIVFLLICFYLLVGQLVRDQKDPSVQLPAMASPVGHQESPAEFVINVRSDGTITIAGHPVTVLEAQKMLADQVTRAAQDRQPLRVVVRADRRGQCGKLDEVLQACREAGLQAVVLRSMRNSQ